jgi:hypothetical protein
MPDENRVHDDPPPTGSLSRRFGVRDGMILVAASALGAWGYRSNQMRMLEQGFVWGNGRIEGWVILGGPGLAAFTAALGISRLLGPRPHRVELFRQPGFVAVFVALVLTLRRFLVALIEDWFMTYDDWSLEDEWFKVTQQASMGIVVAWSVLALAGCLKPERGWIDRASRVVALVWILWGVLCWILPIYECVLIQKSESLP